MLKVERQNVSFILLPCENNNLLLQATDTKIFHEKNALFMRKKRYRSLHENVQMKEYAVELRRWSCWS